MASAQEHSSFKRLETVGQFDVSGKTLLIPNMAPLGSDFLAASFRAFGVPAVMMETYTGLALGKEFTSGKECFPCQVTLGDILHHLELEKKRLGSAFSPRDYVYFMPESDGPCRFGMYNKLQRLVLDQFEEFRDVDIVYVSTEGSYSTSSILPPDRARYFRRLAYVAAIIADVLDRTVWRARPYEYRPGIVDEFMKEAVEAMKALIEKVGARREFHKLFDLLQDIVATTRSLMDHRQPRRPLIGIVGEIYLRCHPDSNQQIIRNIEAFGGEVVDASIGEWINFVTYENARKTRRSLRLAWNRRDHAGCRNLLGELISLEIEKLYQRWRQYQAYQSARRHLDIALDHSIGSIERRLDRDRLFTFDIGTEACLSIGGALEYIHHGFDGVVNVYPFTCMPSTICSSVLKPLLHQQGIPYLDAAYDGSYQPNREVALRTFMYQAKQHMDLRQNGRRVRH